MHGPSHDLHSGVFGGAVMNPVTAAAHLIASLHDQEGKVAIDGFYNAVRPLLDWEREAAAALPFTDADIRGLAGVPELAGEPGFSAIERVGARPTAEVNGMGGGYQGEGTKTVLPREAFAKLTFRLVPNQKPEEILRLAEAHLRAHCPKGCAPGHPLRPRRRTLLRGPEFSLRKGLAARARARFWAPACPHARGWFNSNRHHFQEGAGRRFASSCARRRRIVGHTRRTRTFRSRTSLPA